MHVLKFPNNALFSAEIALAISGIHKFTAHKWFVVYVMLYAVKEIAQVADSCTFSHDLLLSFKIRYHFFSFPCSYI
jgi:hypothetical protein